MNSKTEGTTASWPRDDSSQFGIAITQAGVMAIWLVCIAVSALGLKLKYEKAHLPPIEPIPPSIVQAEVPLPPAAPVELPARPNEAVAPAAPTLAPTVALPDVPPPPEAPAPVAAIPDPAIGFAVPVEGPVRIVDRKLASPVTGGINVQHLQAGIGIGQQPDPPYPRQALNERQQGKVTVQFVVGADGRVTSAQLVKACRWPLLNQAVLLTIRNEWRFPTGAVRTYDISYDYTLTEQ